MDDIGVLRPRNVDWKRGAALLYGDWGTSKAYVVGLAFFYAGYSALPIIAAVCALTALVGYNYSIVCKHFPDGGGVYSAARTQSRSLAVIGALLLVANFMVTAALSCWAGMNYFGVPPKLIPAATMLTIAVIGALNYFGPKHTGSLGIALGIPTVCVVVLIVLLSLPFLTFANLQPPTPSFGVNWRLFVSVILALSGVEAIANLTGVMKLDPGSTMERPCVAQTARKAIFPVAAEVVLGTFLLGWATLSLPMALAPDRQGERDSMLRYVGEQYTALWTTPAVGVVAGIVIGVVFGLLLLSAVNTAIAAQIGLYFMLARDGEMPKAFCRLNPHGVPRWPLVLATALPVAVVAATRDMESLARLYAIGVIGAIAVNLGSCTFNLGLPLRWFERAIMALTSVVLFAVEVTIAKTNNDALFFAICVLGLGFTLRGIAHRRAGLKTVTISEEIAAQVVPEAAPAFQPNLNTGQTIMVAARGLTPVLRYALEEARLRQASLYVLYVKELAVSLAGAVSPGPTPRWQNDRQAAKIMSAMLALGKEYNVPVIPVYAVSDDPATTILDMAATLGVDILMLGSPQRRALVRLLKGNVVTEVANSLPENIQLVIHG